MAFLVPFDPSVAYDKAKLLFVKKSRWLDEDRTLPVFDPDAGIQCARFQNVECFSILILH